MTRIAHLIETDGFYGAERVVLTLLEHTRQDAALQPILGCLVASARTSDLAVRARAAGVTAFDWPLRKAWAPRDLARIFVQLERQRPGMLHCHGYKASIAGYLYARLARIPIVATCHLWTHEPKAAWTYRVLTALELRLYPRFDAVAAVSSPIRATLLQRGVAPQRVRLIPNGILPGRRSRETGTTARLRHALGIDQGAPVVVSVGRLAEQKGHRYLLRAARRLRLSHPTLRVLIVGDGPLRNELHGEIAQHGLEPCVHLLGFRADIPDLLALADVFALPSNDEGLPIALLEAFAAGVPVVATPVGAVPDLVSPDATGLLVPPRDDEALAAAIDRLLQDRALGDSISRNALALLQSSYTADAMYTRYRALYGELLNGGQS
ncbi:MAG: glycosyltransferase [Armatimonadota bacterium]|nr:glycosyltransferase [Armatimonadota bacterium]